MGNLRSTDMYFKPDASGAYRMQKWRRNILPAWLTYDLASNSGALAVAAAGTATKTVEFRQPYFSNQLLDGGFGTPLEIRSLIASSYQSPSVTPSEYLINFYQAGEIRKLMNIPLHVDTLFGTGQLPAVLREPLFFNSMDFLQMNATKITGGATSAYLYLSGAQYYPWAPAFLEDSVGKQKITQLLKEWKKRTQFVAPFWLSPEGDKPSVVVNATTGSGLVVGANATVSAVAKIGTDAHFEALTLTGVSTGEFEFEITEAFTRQTLMNGKITKTNGVGTARFPVMFPVGYLLPAGRYLRFNITDLSGSTNNVFLTVAGRKIYAPLKKAAKVEQQTRVRSLPIPADSAQTLIPMGP